jgi:hypothetical protein
MTSYHYWIYFDIETLGVDPSKDKIITIQYQTLVYDEEGNRKRVKIDGRPPHTLTILKDWQYDEKTILQQAYKDLGFAELEKLDNISRHWFEPVGNILSFEGKFPKTRFMKHGIIGSDGHLRFGQLTLIDLRPLMILINGGNYDTTKFFGKIGENKLVPVWYEKKEYDKIEDYVQREAASFTKTLDYLVANLPKMKNDILALHT